MLRQTAVLAIGFGAVVCCGCGGNASSSPTTVAAHNSAPPKPIPFKEGEAAAAAKAGAEVPTQLGGPQIRNLLGISRAAAATNAGSGGNANSQADSSVPKDSTATAAAPANPTTTAPPANDPSAPANAAAPPTNDPSASRNTGRGSRRRDGSPASPQQTDPSAPANGQDAVKAEAGVGAQGKDYGNADGGYISEPVSMYFNARELIYFQQMTKGMRFFEADKGRKPKSHEEFMKEIIEAYGVKLPELPAGQKYQYDPQKGELMVIRPKK